MTAIDQALAAHQSGKLDEAESLYRRILAADARNFDALHMLGMVHFQHGQIEQAEQLVRTALSIRPSIVQCLQNYGNILYCLGRYKDAAESFRRALSQRPDFFRRSGPWSSCYWQRAVLQRRSTTRGVGLRSSKRGRPNLWSACAFARLSWSRA